MLTRHWRARMQLWTRKSASVFLHGRALVNPEIESIRACLCVCVYFFYSWSLSPSIPPPLPHFSHGRRTRRGRFISTPVAIVPFVSPACMPRGDELSLSIFSIYLPPTASLFLSASLSVTLSVTLALHGRFERWTNRLDVISTYPRIHV